MKLNTLKPLVEAVAPRFKGVAKSKSELVDSIEDGYFTLDGRKLKENVCFYGGKGLKSLVGMPETAHSNVFVGNNELTDLKGCPQDVVGSFRCSNNHLTTLEGGPTRVLGSYICSQNMLKTLKGAAEQVQTLMANDNQLTTLEGCPRFIESTVNVNNNKITSLHGIDTFIEMFSHDGAIELEGNPVKERVLGLLLIPQLHRVRLDNKKLEHLLNGYLSKMKNVAAKKDRKKFLLECQSEMLDLGMDDLAQL